MISILPPEMSGLMFVSGYRGIGKSYLAAQADVPSNIAFFDFEEKGAGIHAQLNFGLYRALTRETADLHGPKASPHQLFEVITSAFNELESNRYTVAILDNIKPFENALRSEVERDPKRYGVKPANVPTGKFGGAWPGVHYLVSSYCDLLYAKGIRLVIATSHIKSQWGPSGPLLNKYDVKGVDRWQELSILTLILIPGKYAPIPAAIVQKEQLGAISFDAATGKHTVQRRLPLRLPKCTFAEIKHYLREPADIANPKEGEVPTFEEADPFSKKLSREQIALVKLALEAEMREETSMFAAMPEPLPTTWQDLLTRTGKMLDDLGGIEAAKAMTEEQVRAKWEEWR